MQQLLDFYYANNAKQLRKMVKKILWKFKLTSEEDIDEFISIANVVITQILPKYNPDKNFHVYLYGCLNNKFKSELSRRNRLKRTCDRMAISLNSRVPNCGKNSYSGDITLEDILVDKQCIEDEVIAKVDRSFNCGFSDDKAKKYFNSLSDLQKKIVLLLLDGNNSKHIQLILHINPKTYLDNLKRIQSYENIKVLL